MQYKVLRIIYDWPNPWDGLAPAPYYLTKRQLNLGNSVTVFCGRWKKSGGPELIKNLKLQSFPREPIRGLMLLTTAPLMTLYFLIWRVFNKVDIYHIHGHFGLYIYLYKFIFGWLDKTPIISHFHNTTKGRIEDQKLNPSKDTLVEKFIHVPLSLLSDKIAVKVSAACVFVSKRNLEEAVKYYSADRSKCYVVESGVASEIFKPALKANLKIKSILYVGALSERKNIHVLVESLKYLPKAFTITLVGRGYESYIHRLKKIALDNKVAERVFFKGYVENADLVAFYKSSSVFAIPSTYEGLPKVVIESLACGTPVVASGFEIKSPITGLYFLNKATPKLLASTIMDVVSLKKGVDVAYISKFYSWEAKAKEVQNIYDKIVSKI